MPTVIRLLAVVVLLVGALIEIGVILIAAWQGSAATSSPPLHSTEWIVVSGFCLTLGLVLWWLVRSLLRWADRIELNRFA